MRRLSLILLLATLLLFIVADVRWEWVRLPGVGFESGLVIAGGALLTGSMLTAVATWVSWNGLRSAAGSASLRGIRLWCFALVLGFAALAIG